MIRLEIRISFCCLNDDNDSLSEAAGIIEVVTYSYFFEATLSAEGGSYAQLAALIEKAMLMIKRRLFLITTWDLYFLSGCGTAKAQMSAFWVKVT